MVSSLSQELPFESTASSLSSPLGVFFPHHLGVSFWAEFGRMSILHVVLQALNFVHKVLYHGVGFGSAVGFAVEAPSA